jgi:hypothetical protein
MDKKETVTILIPTRFDSRYMIELCLETIKKYTEYPHKVIVGDAGVDAETRDFLEARKDIKLVKTDNPNLPKDSMIKFVDTPYFLFLHDDTQILQKGWLSKRVKLMERNPRNAIVGTVVASFVYGWKRRFLYKKSMRRFWPLVLLVKTDVQRELRLRWGVIAKNNEDAHIYRHYWSDANTFDTGGMAYQQFTSQKKYRFIKCKFHKEIMHFGGMTWPVKKKVNKEKASFDIDEVINARDKKVESIKQILISRVY